MTELTQQITKLIRGKQDMIHLIEEFVDVCLSLGYIKEILNIKDEDIKVGCTIKYNRLKDILNNGKCT